MPRPDIAPNDAPPGMRPLYVDLDGTLTPIDSLHESVMMFALRSPLNPLRLLAWLSLGKAGFKQRLADAVRPDPARLPYRQDLLRYLRREHARGRPLVLASAADVRTLRDVARFLGIFGDCLGTEGGLNLSGEHKRQAIEAHALAGGHSQWDYVGNSRDDLAVWPACTQAVAVNASAPVLAQLRQQHPDAQVFERQPLRLSTVLRAIRLRQWAKNALLFIPLLSAHAASPQAWGALALGFLAFGLCASATYLFNDLLDLPSDRMHRLKRRRPLAAGTLSIPAAVLLGAVMLVLAFALALVVSAGFAAMLLLYTAITLAYSIRLKRLPLVDVLVLAALYTLRLGAGAVAVQVVPSNWLLAISVFLFLSLALVKRCAELEETIATADVHLAPGRGYQPRDLPTLRGMGMTSGFLSVMVLTLYIDSQSGRLLYAEPQWLWAAAPVLLLWIMRIWLKTGRRELRGEDPLQFALRDRVSWFTLALLMAVGLLASQGLAT